MLGASPRDFCAALREHAAMSAVHVEFAPALQRHHPCAAQTLAGGSLAQVLDAALAAQPALRAYVLTDQGDIRKHVAVFVNAQMHFSRADLSRALVAGDRVYVAQCLTGG
jgi:sulfur-carrier protein